MTGARPVLDERFAVGLCETCSRWPKPAGKPRPEGLDPSKAQPLVREKDWTPETIEQRRGRERDRRILARPRNDAEHGLRAELLQRYEREDAARQGRS